MRLVEAHQISKNHPFFKECDRLSKLSKNLWNATNYAIRQFYFETGKYLDYSQVNKNFTVNNQADYRSLPAKVAKGTQRLLDKSYRSFFKIPGYKNKPGYLHKTNGRQVVHYEKGALSKRQAGFVKLSQTFIKLKTDQDADFVRIVPKNDYFVIEIGYSVTLPVPSATTGNVVGIDLGLKNLATISSNVMAPLIINGQPISNFNSYSHYLLFKTINGSHMSRSIYRKRFNKIKDYFHKSTKFLVDQFVQYDIKTVVVGYNENWKQGSKLSKFNQIPHELFVKILTYKCQMSGIKVIKQEESYTSKASFYDLDVLPKLNDKNIPMFSGRRIKRGLYCSKNKQLINADLNGSLNILRKSKIWKANFWQDCVKNSRLPITRYSF